MQIGLFIGLVKLRSWKTYLMSRSRGLSFRLFFLIPLKNNTWARVSPMKTMAMLYQTTCVLTQVHKSKRELSISAIAPCWWIDMDFPRAWKIFTRKVSVYYRYFDHFQSVWEGNSAIILAFKRSVGSGRNMIGWPKKCLDTCQRTNV